MVCLVCLVVVPIWLGAHVALTNYNLKSCGTLKSVSFYGAQEFMLFSLQQINMVRTVDHI